MKKGDIAVAVILLTLALAVWLPGILKSGGEVTASVYEDGVLIGTVRLSASEAPRTIPVRGGMILVKDGRIGYTEADCPDHSCMRAGMLSKPGQTAACVPNRTMIVLEGSGNEAVPDAVTY